MHPGQWHALQAQEMQQRQWSGAEQQANAVEKEREEAYVATLLLASYEGASSEFSERR